MKKSELIEALKKIPDDPEIAFFRGMDDGYQIITQLIELPVVTRREREELMLPDGVDTFWAVQDR